MRQLIACVVFTLTAACAAPSVVPPALREPDPLPATASPRTQAARDTGSATTVPTVGTFDEQRRREIETLTRPLWFGWYAAVASGDAEALGGGVARNRIHADGVAAIEGSTLGFSTTPRLEDYRFTVTEVLRDDDDCIVIELQEDPRAFLVDAIVAERIGVFWEHEGSWYLATSWTIDTPEFAWADDCDLMVRDFA